MINEGHDTVADALDATVETDGVGIEDKEGDDLTTIVNETITNTPALNVAPNLDIDEENGTEDHDVYDDNDLITPELEANCDDENVGVQQEYVKAIQLRLKEEIRHNNPSTNLWLLGHLKKNGWWIRQEHSSYIVSKLGLKKKYSAYYRDVYIWLPDIHWGEMCMPCCPSCKSKTHVSNHGFHENHFGGINIGMKEMYYTIT